MTGKSNPSTIELYARSLIFWVVSVPWMLLIVTSVLLLFFMPVNVRYAVASQWAKGEIKLLKWICNIDYQIKGLENLPDGAAIILSNHQSTWETLAFQKIFPQQLWVLKKELLKVPFFGWGLALCEPIAIDRSAGRKAMDQLVDQGQDRLSQGRWVIIFPEGTRTPPGKKVRYKLGGSVLASKVDFPIVPVAHNAGEYWPRHSLVKHPGTITISIGPVVRGYGREPEDINKEVEVWIRGELESISGSS